MLAHVACMFDDVCSIFFYCKNVLISTKHFLQHTTNDEVCSHPFNNLYCKDYSGQSPIREPRAIQNGGGGLKSQQTATKSYPTLLICPVCFDQMKQSHGKTVYFCHLHMN